MTAFERLWLKFAKSKKYRESYVASHVKRSIPFQIRQLMKKGGLTQQKLAEQSGLTQGVISRAADLNYGDLALNTIIRVAAGLDCAFVGKFVPFSEFCRTVTRMPEEEIGRMPSFQEENEIFMSGKRDVAADSEPTSAGEVDSIKKSQLGALDQPWMKNLEAILGQLGELAETQETQASSLGLSRKPPASEELASMDDGLARKQRSKGLLHEAA